MPRSRMKAETPLLPRAGSVRAITTATSATPALVMKALLPFNTKRSPSRSARELVRLVEVVNDRGDLGQRPFAGHAAHRLLFARQVEVHGRARSREAAVGGRQGGAVVRSNLLASRATSLGRLRLPPHPPEAGGAPAAPPAAGPARAAG